jgi:hypothetical protein
MSDRASPSAATLREWRGQPERLSGLQTPQDDEVVLSPPDAAVGHLPQEPDRRPGETARSFLARRPRVAPAQSTMDTAAQALADGGADRYSPALDRWLPAWRRFGTTPAGHASHHDIRQELSLAAARATAQWAQP